MKVRARLSGPSQDTERCFSLGLNLSEAECGLAFASFFLTPERLEKAPTIWTYDVAGGLATAVAHLNRVANRFRGAKTSAKTKQLAEKISRTWKNLKQKGSTVEGAAAERLKQQLQGFRQEFMEIKGTVEKSCRLKTPGWKRHYKNLMKRMAK